MNNGQMGNHPLNGNDAVAILNIVFGWIEESPDEYPCYASEELQARLENAGYGKPELEEATGGFPEGLSVEEKREYLRSHNLAVTIVDGRIGLIAREDLN